MTKLLLGLLFLCGAALTSPADAFVRGSAVTPVNGAPAGYSQVNASGLDVPGGLLNVLDSGDAISLENGATPDQLDNNGIPASPLTASQIVIYNLTFDDLLLGVPSTPWVFKWTPPGDGVIRFNGLPITVTGSPTGCTVTSGPTITMTAGTPCRVDFTFNSTIGPFPIQMQFLAANYAPGAPKPVMCRTSDEAAIAAGQYFTPELVSTLQGANLKTLRYMPWILNPSYNNGDNLGAWGYRTPTTAISWQSSRYYPGIYAGTATGTDFYTVTPGAGTPLTDWTDGETIQATIANVSTLSYTISNAVNNGSGLIRLTVNSTTGMTTGQKIYITGVNGTVEANGVWAITVINGTTIDLQGSTFTNAYSSSGNISVQTLTVSGKTNGTKLIAFYNAAAGQPVAAGLGTFVYSKLLDVVLLRSGMGITGGFPIEAMIDLSNRLNVNMWYTLPMMANDGFVTSLGAMVRDGLSPALSLYFEYSNETWNNGAISQFGYAYNSGQFLQIGGYPGFTGVRAATIFNLIKPVWIANGRSASTLRRSLMWQAYGDASIQYYTMNSTESAPTNNRRLCIYLGGTFSGTCSGAPNYSTPGNRPIDFSDVGGYALYTSGQVIKNFGYGYAPSVTPYVISSLQTMATAFNSNPSDPTSLAFIDDDLRQGVLSRDTISSVSGTTINTSGTAPPLHTQVVFYTSGALPSPLQTGKMYFVTSSTTGAFSVSATYSGSAISLSGGSGTHSFGNLNVPGFIVGNQSLIEFVNTITQNIVGSPEYSPGWEGVVAGYDSFRSGAGLASIRIEQYEGALEAKMPTAAECAAMGITVGGSSATAATALANGFLAYKNSAYGRALSLSLFNQFMGADASAPTFGLMAHSRTPSWFLLSGTSNWSLLSGPLGSTPFQTYDGIAAFVGQLNFLLKRDLDSASNDNDPMFLEKAA